MSPQFTSRPLTSILKENFLTLFNLMLAVVAVFVLAAGAPQDCLFLLVVIINAGIGIAVELKAKQDLDRLTLLTAERYWVNRGGKKSHCLAAEIIVGDEIELTLGQQIPADGVIISGNLEVKEAILTGEAANVAKHAGSQVLSGTAVAVGAGRMRAQAVGDQAYVSQLEAAAKKYRLATSSLRRDTNQILKVLGVLLVPLALLLVATQLQQQGGLIGAWQTDAWRTAVIQAAAGIVGLIPEGLVLLTSLNFALAALKLARRKVLVTQLNSVETLARLDEIIFDKTGTITDGNVTVAQIVALGAQDQDWQALVALANLPGGTTTSAAISDYLTARGYQKKGQVKASKSFDPAKKYSQVNLAGTIYRLGAGEVLSPQTDLSRYTQRGQRVLVLTQNKKVRLIIICQERLRSQVGQIIKNFHALGVGVQIVSGDSEATVRALGRQVGITRITGRAQPETKSQIIQALQAQGKVVAMVGDGINDLLALKAADLGIVMGAGAGASRAVADLVLLENDFAQIPLVLAEGRRCLANIERVAVLFLSKTFYSLGLVLTSIIAQLNYPFLPRQLTLVSALTIGIPGFLLSLPPDHTPYRPGFLRRVLSYAFTGGLLVTITITALTLSGASARVKVIALLTLGLLILTTRARPLKSWRVGLVLGLALLAAVIFYLPLTREFFAL